MRKIQRLTLLFLVATTTTLMGQKIEVTGTAQKSVQPTAIIVEASLLMREGSATKVLKETEASMEAIIKYINKTAGISQISSNALQIEGIWDKNKKDYTYEGRQTLTIKIDSIPIYDEVIQKLSKQGVNEIASVRYYIPKEESIKGALLAEAIKNARMKADIIAKELGTKVLAVADVQECDSPSGSALLTVEPTTQGSMLPSSVMVRTTLKVAFKL